MTRKEHISNLETIGCDGWTVTTEAYKSLQWAIQSLSQEPCEDAISREDAEQMFRNIRCHLKPQDYKSAEEFNTRDLMLLNAEQMIHALPSVTQKSGKWIEHPEIETSAPEYLMFYECSECGDKQCFCKPDIHKKRFCSNCGAKMQESEDKE